ncbi:uncharacterized protein [Periplaneta americana]|uniref:uncharacterized protein n=1 Tax=Periplaneta americana TaxID=6978 RepID=UPI0037E742C1
MLTQSGEEPIECPLCMEPLEVDDLTFFPCTCGYQICRFCWHRIRTDENGLCPACRKPYAEDPADFRPLSREEVAHLKAQKKQKNQQRKQKIMENRKHLANVRVVQRNLVFVVGLSSRLADGEVLKKHEYFGKYGKIQKVVINKSNSYAGSQGPSASAYLTYQKSDDALRAIQAVNNIIVDGRPIRSSLGTTKYCSHFLKNQMCPKPDCMYLHELGDAEASFTKEDIQQGKHQEYEKRLHEQFLRERKQASAVVVPSNSFNCQTMNGSAMNCPAGLDGSTKQHTGQNSASKLQGVLSDDRQHGFPFTDSTKSPSMQERRYRSAGSSQSHSITKIDKGVCDFSPKEIVNSKENSSHREDSMLTSSQIIEMTDSFSVAASADEDLGVSVTVTDRVNPDVKIVDNSHSPMFYDTALNQLSGSKSGSQLFMHNQPSRTNKRFHDDARQKDRQHDHTDNGDGESLNMKSKLSDKNFHSQISAVKRGVPSMNRFQNGKDKGKHSSGFLYHQHKNKDADAKYTKSIMNDAKMTDNGRTYNDMGFDPFRKSHAALAEMVKKETLMRRSFNQHNAFSQLPNHLNAVEECHPGTLVNRQQRQNHRLPTNVTGCTKLLDDLGLNRGMSAGSSVSRRTRFPPPGFATSSSFIPTFGISQSRSDADL